LSAGDIDVSPLCFRQIWALVLATARELLWGLRAVSGELRAWRARARCIPDAPLRRHALRSIACKRGHADGAALFWILPRRRHPRLLALLVAYQTAWDFLDETSEYAAGAGEANGRQLHLALVRALDPYGPGADYYRHHPCRHDGGYLRALVQSCREACAQLPAYGQVRVPVLAEAARCAVQSLNHQPHPDRRDAALRQWVEVQLGDRPEGSWFELTAAASASLVPHVLLALASEPACSPYDVTRAHAAYLPWVSLATAMLDSYADLGEDLAGGEHSYIAHYPDAKAAVTRLVEIIERATSEVLRLRGGERHAVLVACMVSLYLSKDSARAPQARAHTSELLRAGGSLPRLLAPVLRAWRVAYAQRTA
jgi:tetraprenyl-beta-curcumene synthase